MTKHEIHQQFIRKLTEELATITAAARASISTATDEAHHAEGKYDTFSLETSYLARGQARRVEELRHALDRLTQMPVKALGESDPIQLSALVHVRSEKGEDRLLYLGSAGGGESMQGDVGEIVIVTSQSPLGRALLGKKTGDSFTIQLAGAEQLLTIKAVG